jgi:hypothetical protein
LFDVEIEADKNDKAEDREESGGHELEGQEVSVGKEAVEDEGDDHGEVEAEAAAGSDEGGGDEEENTGCPAGDEGGGARALEMTDDSPYEDEEAIAKDDP